MTVGGPEDPADGRGRIRMRRLVRGCRGCVLSGTWAFFPPARAEEIASTVPFEETLVIVIVGAFVLCVGLVATALWALARQRRQIADLMARLDAVEAADDIDAGDDGLEETEPVRPESPDDVLHGRTTYVQAMIEGADSGSRTLADRTILAVHKALGEPLTSRRLAEELNVSQRTLERVVSATLGCTPRQLIMTMKMREARRLLLTGEFRVTEVAYRLGFSSPAHFSTRFRRFYQCPPSSFIRGTAGRRRGDDRGPGRMRSNDVG
jgi:AraC-like DNA-binding protein